MAADQAELLGVELPSFTAETRAELDTLLPPTATVANPLDWTAMIWDQPDRLRQIVAAVGEDPAIDQLLLLFDQPPRLPPESAGSWAAVRDALVDGAEPTKSGAILAATMPDLIDAETALRLAERGIPFVAGLRTALACCLALRAASGDPDRLREIATATVQARGRPLSGNGWMGEAEAKALLRRAGVPVPAGRVARDAADAVRAAGEVGWPVALKLSGAGVQHKSDLGALALGIAADGELREAWSRLRALAAADGAEVLVERMAPPGVELLIAARADGVVPALVIALGGIWTEALDDVAVIPLPADRGAGRAGPSLTARGLAVDGRTRGRAGRPRRPVPARRDLRRPAAVRGPRTARAEPCDRPPGRGRGGRRPGPTRIARWPGRSTRTPLCGPLGRGRGGARWPRDGRRPAGRWAAT